MPELDRGRSYVNRRARPARVALSFSIAVLTAVSTMNSWATEGGGTGGRGLIPEVRIRDNQSLQPGLEGPERLNPLIELGHLFFATRPVIDLHQLLHERVLGQARRSRLCRAAQQVVEVEPIWRHPGRWLRARRPSAYR